MPINNDEGFYSGSVRIIDSNVKIQHGHGTFISNSDNSRYDGKWHNGLKHGYGTLKFDNGDLYTGLFEYDYAHS